MIACLGWGSLIWKPDDLPVVGEWQPDGPALPVEYTRVSRGNRLTLVITGNASALPVLWASLGASDLNQAIAALAAREGIERPEHIAAWIGYWSRDRQSTQRELTDIGDWAGQRAIDAVVWTALPSGFRNNRGSPLTLAEALGHLRSLRPEERPAAEEYIRRTPRQIDTDYRRAFEREFGWHPL